jgi:CheY-like chemotaxis protein
MRKRGPIVVIDDDPDEQYLYRKVFEKMNLEGGVLSFDNGADALDYLRQPAVDPFLILCDINIPLMSGLQVREEMCKSKMLCKKNTPFVFMSTSARQTDIDAATAMFTHGFFQKETSFEKHATLLKKIIDYWSSCRYFESQAA